jgi:hypothetical protein
MRRACKSGTMRTHSTLRKVILKEACYWQWTDSGIFCEDSLKLLGGESVARMTKREWSAGSVVLFVLKLQKTRGDAD